MSVVEIAKETSSAQHNTQHCHECHFPIQLPNLSHKQAAICPRCKFNITIYHDNASQKIIAYALCALIFLCTSLFFDFLSFSANGKHQTIDILGSLVVLIEQDYALLALVQAVCMLILPAYILLSLLYLLVPSTLGYRPPKANAVLAMVFTLLPWAMAEIFLVGVLVSLIKVMSMADVGIGLSFYAYVLFIVFMTSCFLYVDKHQLEQLFAIKKTKPTQTISASQSIQTTWALLATAVLLYIPANILPIMHTNFLGSTEPSTILGGVILLWKMGSYPIAIIIFVASVLVPVAKLIILAWLNYSVQKQHQQKLAERMFWYRVTEFIGRWSMIDVFVVAVLVSLIQLGNLMSIVPGHAALAFCTVVITTMLAAMSFDTKLIWQNPKIEKSS